MWGAGTWPCAQVGSLFYLEEESQRPHTGAGNVSVLTAAHCTQVLTSYRRAGTSHAWCTECTKYWLIGRVGTGKPRLRDLRKLLGQVARVESGLEPGGKPGQPARPLHCTVPGSPEVDCPDPHTHRLPHKCIRG